MNIDHVKFINACINDDADHIDEFSDYFAFPDSRPTNLKDRTINGFTGIHYATFYEAEQVFTKLIRLHYDLKTPVATCIQLECSEQFEEVLVSRNEGNSVPSSPCASPVLISEKLMQILLPSGSTPLTIAIVIRNMGFFNKITEFYSIQQEVKAEHGEDNPLHVAARVPNTTFAFSNDCLLECLSVKNQDGETPLFIAARYKRYDIIQELQKHIAEDHKGIASALIYTAFCQLYDGRSLAQLAFSIEGNSMFAVAAGQMVQKADAFSKTYEDYELESALIEYERFTGIRKQNAKFEGEMTRLQGDGRVDWI